ncbi:tautomerase family protein [Aestuariicoccus sp. MJ-SS9]|uniref:tautomerase family protein n=1 Tax=Aestuariicoccus sp. MJ-SS9 TaxID=3079855 RepID=UPI00290E99E2|nr:tautomerase family protein [Aestuariicoccus sp. MJ-SS9]MDU8910644.1 tautomerase family protein [Aestuariicoccus sp. MJ-SS9]
MPVVEIHLLEGYESEAKTRLCEAVTDAVRSVVPAAPDAVTIFLHDYPAENYMRGRTRCSGAAALPDPAGIVRDYLTAMEARDLATAESHLGAGFVMHFPGAPPMHRLTELIEWAKPRYRFVRKTIDAVEPCPSPGPTLVFVHGTLAGEWPDGTPFEGIRFIDRFELEGGKILRQDVWNDIAEVRP